MSDTDNKIAELEEAMTQPDFWQDKEKAQSIIKELQDLKAEAVGADKYDEGDAMMTIFSGAGGIDAEDFSRILLEMYQHFVGRQGWETLIAHQNINDHGGFRNVTIQIEGRGAYGILKNESGVHRLVRISPFNAKKLRHTSFSLVEVIPRFKKAKTEAIPEDEIKAEFAKSGGPGGQNVNKRETAVRLIHQSTGLSAHSDSERTQVANREKALAILEAKLYRFREAERQQKTKSMYISKTTDIEWGNQIRSYVLHPYKLVKDHRTGVESRQVEEVLAGQLDEFIEAENQL
jgi:peptide chain release factor 2